MTPIHSKPLFETRTKGDELAMVFAIVPGDICPYVGICKICGRWETYYWEELELTSIPPEYTIAAIRKAQEGQEHQNVKTGKELISDERDRQITQERWSDEHDDEHSQGELLSAAAVYMSAACDFCNGLEDVLWPWNANWFKPGKPVDKVRCLAKAGALVAAEIDRLQRCKKSKECAGQQNDNWIDADPEKVRIGPGGKLQVRG